MGPYRALVTDNNDPEKRGRVKVALPDLFWDPYEQSCVESPWVESNSPASDRQGFVNIPPVGEAVWVFVVDSTETGEAWELMYTGGPASGSPDKPSMPEVAKGEDDETTTAFKGGVTLPEGSGKTALEPDPNGDVLTIDGAARLKSMDGYSAPRYPLPSADMRIVASDENGGKFIDSIVNPEDERAEVIRTSEIAGLPNTYNDGEYPNNRVIKTPGGLCVELDDTEGAERLHIWHPSGSYWELSSKGTMVERSSNRFSETVNDSHIVKGTQRLFVSDSSFTNIRKSELKTVKGRKVTTASSIGMQAANQLLLRTDGEMSIISEGFGTQMHIGGRLLKIGGTDVISRAAKKESVMGRADVTYSSDLLVKFSGVNPLPGGTAAEAILASSVGILSPVYGGGACMTCAISPLYASVTSLTGAHLEIHDPTKFAAAAATAYLPAGVPASDGFVVRGSPNVAFVTGPAPLATRGAQPLAKWPVLAEYFALLETEILALRAAILAIAPAAAAGAAGAAVAHTAAAAAATAAANPALAAAETANANAAGGAALAATPVAGVVTAMATATGVPRAALLAAANTPLAAGYTIALRSE